MKLLLDQSLSPRLASRLDDLFPGTLHVRDVGLEAADDKHRLAVRHGQRLLYYVQGCGFPPDEFPKESPAQGCLDSARQLLDYPDQQLLRSQSNAIMEFDVDAEAAFLALR